MMARPDASVVAQRASPLDPYQLQARVLDTDAPGVRAGAARGHHAAAYDVCLHARSTNRWRDGAVARAGEDQLVAPIGSVRALSGVLGLALLSTESAASCTGQSMSNRRQLGRRGPVSGVSRW